MNEIKCTTRRRYMNTKFPLISTLIESYHVRKKKGKATKYANLAVIENEILAH